MKKHAIFLISIVLLMATGCGEKEKKDIPADVIPREQMIDLMVDAWFIESVIHNTVQDYDKLEAASVSYYAYFFEENGISKDQFIHSVEYYMSEEYGPQKFLDECSQRFEERREELTGVAIPVSQPQ
jgi:hypothetical protein